MKKIKLLCLLMLFASSAYSQFNKAKSEKYAYENDNFTPGFQASVLVGNRSYEVDLSYTDILTYGIAIERTQDKGSNGANGGKPFYAYYATFGGEFERITLTVKLGSCTLQQIGADYKSTHFVYGGSIEYRITPNIGIIVSADKVAMSPLGGITYHFGEK